MGLAAIVAVASLATISIKELCVAPAALCRALLRHCYASTVPGGYAISRALIEDRKLRPQDPDLDPISSLLDVRVDGAPLPDGR